MNKPNAGIVLAAMLALAGGDLPMLKFRPSKEHCVQCRVKIPPGKAGRRCEKCQKENP